MDTRANGRPHIFVIPLRPTLVNSSDPNPYLKTTA